jgi:hypothetical protein
MSTAEERLQDVKSRIQNLKLQKATAEGTLQEVGSQQQQLKEEFIRNGVTPQTIDEELAKSQQEEERLLQESEQQVSALEADLKV